MTTTFGAPAPSGFFHPAKSHDRFSILIFVAA
jgi:hypothetical protein